MSATRIKPGSHFGNFIIRLFKVSGVRESTIEEIKRMQAYLDADETELYELTVSVLKKLEIISDKEFDLIDPISYFDE